MAKKKIDLSEQYKRQQQDINRTATRYQQDSEHLKYAGYIENEEQKVPQESDVKNGSKKINMAFSDKVYDMIKQESEKIGISMSGFVNGMIKSISGEQIKDTYDRQLVKASRDLIPRKKGKASKRIQIKFEPEVYEKIVDGSEMYSQTLTQYVNLVLSVSTR